MKRKKMERRGEWSASRNPSRASIVIKGNLAFHWLGESTPADSLDMSLSASPDGGELDGKELACGVNLGMAEDILEVNFAHWCTRVLLDEGDANLCAPTHDRDCIRVQVEIGVSTQGEAWAGRANELLSVEVGVQEAHVEWVGCVHRRVGESQSDGNSPQLRAAWLTRITLGTVLTVLTILTVWTYWPHWSLGTIFSLLALLTARTTVSHGALRPLGKLHAHLVRIPSSPDEMSSHAQGNRNQ